MKKVTTNITFGQIMFILANFFVASFIFFYLGAKFGPDILNLDDNERKMAGLLPEEKFAEEVKVLLQNKKHDFMFDGVLSGKTSMPAVIEEPKPLVATKVATVVKVESAIETNSSTKLAPLIKTNDEPTKTQHSIDDIDVTDAERGNKPVADQNKIFDTTALTDSVPQQSVMPPVAAGDMILEEAGKPALLVDDEVLPSAAFSLQIGSYADKRAASLALSVWQKRGFDARVVSYDIKGKGTWYRLELGSFTSEDQAITSQQSIMSKYKQSARVVEQENSKF